MGCRPGMGRLGTSGHLCPSATLSLCPWLNYGGPAQLCPRSPLLRACSSARRGSAPSSCCRTPKGLFPSAGGSFRQAPLLAAQDPIARSCPAGVFCFSPFHSYLSPFLQCEGQVGVPRLGTVPGSPHGWEGLSTLHRVSGCSCVWEQSGSALASATPALFRRGVNWFHTGTSSCYYWEREDWNNLHVHGGESVPSGQVLSSSRTGVGNKSVSRFSSKVPAAASTLSLLGKGRAMLPGFSRSSAP